MCVYIYIYILGPPMYLANCHVYQYYQGSFLAKAPGSMTLATICRKWLLTMWPWKVVIGYLPSGKHTIQKTMERSTMLSMGKSTISTGPWLPVRYFDITRPGSHSINPSPFSLVNSVNSQDFSWLHTTDRTERLVDLSPATCADYIGLCAHFMSATSVRKESSWEIMGMGVQGTKAVRLW